jgi:hypothetical protein
MDKIMSNAKDIITNNIIVAIAGSAVVAVRWAWRFSNWELKEN